MRFQRIADDLEIEREIALQLLVAGMAGAEPGGDGTARLELRERVGDFALPAQRDAGAAVGLRQEVLPVVVARIERGELRGEAARGVGGGERLLDVADGEMAAAQHVERAKLCRGDAGIGLVAHELAERAAQHVENLLRHGRGQAAGIEHVADDGRAAGGPVDQRRGAGERGFGAVALLDRHLLGDERGAPLPGGGASEHHERGDRRPRQHQRAALLAHLLGEQILLRHAVDGGGKVGAELEEPAVVRRALAIGPQIDPFRLAGEALGQRRRQRRVGAAGEVAGGGVPGGLAVGHRDQQRADAVALDPMRDFAIDPGRGRGLGRRQQDEKAGVSERLFDRGPQLGRRRQAGVVAEYAQRAAAVPRLAERLHHRLQRRRHRLVPGVAVGNERVVGRHIPSARDRAPGRISNYSMIMVPARPRPASRAWVSRNPAIGEG